MRVKLTLIAALAVAAGFAIPVAVSVSTAQATTIDPTATGVDCSPGAVPMGQATSCTATVTDSQIGATTPTGFVSFTVVDAQGTFTVGFCTLAAISVVPPPDEQASCSASYTPEQFGSGTQTLTASYLGDSGHAAGSGSELIEQALRATSMNLTCSPATVASGQAPSCTATLTDAGSFDVATPTGTVSFITGTHKGNFTAVGSCMLAAVDVGQASCSLTFTPPEQLPLGTQQIDAAYGGDSEFSPNSAQIAITVTPRATSTNVSCQEVLPALSRCTATVSDISPGTATAPAGTVSFTSSGPGVFFATQCTLAASGTSATWALCTVTYATPEGGPFAGQIITVSYAGDATHQGSTGSTALN